MLLCALVTMRFKFLFFFHEMPMLWFTEPSGVDFAKFTEHYIHYLTILIFVGFHQGSTAEIISTVKDCVVSTTVTIEDKRRQYATIKFDVHIILRVNQNIMICCIA